MIILYATGIIPARRKIIVTMIDCPTTTTSVRRSGMKDEPLQIRAKQAGLSQKTLAAILGVTENTASMQLRGKWQSGTPRYVVAAIVAWELMTHEQRMRWIAELDASAA
jgi:predicted XRE-type DNA-binding protein